MSKTDSTLAGASKTCRTCKAEKPLSEFYKGDSRCKACAAAAKKAYLASPKGKATAAAYWQKFYAEHSAELIAKQRERYFATKDQTVEVRAARHRNYLERNRETISAKRSAKLKDDPAYRARNTERAALWYAAHKEVVSEKLKVRYKENRESIRKRITEYQKANPELMKKLNAVKVHRRRTRLQQSEGHFTRADIDRLLKLQRCKCANCAASLKKGYHIDHRIPVAKGGSNHPSNIELLCKRCNLAKAAKLPHEFAQEQGRLI